jgi:hypothetical protein
MFPDVSIRIEGKFRLGVSLTRLRYVTSFPVPFRNGFLISDLGPWSSSSSRDHEMTLISSGFVAPLAQVYTDVFTVTSQAEYVAPR